MEKNAKAAFGELLKRHVKSSGMSLNELANKMGCKQAYLSQLITGKRNLSPEWFDRIIGVISTRLDRNDIEYLAENYTRVFNTSDTEVLKYTPNRTQSVELDALSLLFVEKFSQLNSTQQIYIMNLMEQIIRDNLKE